MSKRKQTKKTVSHHPKRSRLLVVLMGVAIACLGLLVCMIVATHVAATRSVTESPKSEMKVLPPEVKKQIQTASPAASFRIPVLMYHYVEYVKDTNDKTRQLLNVTPDVFEAQLQTLNNAGYTFMTAKELGDVLDGRMQVPKYPILLTFDDGHWDLDTVVLPLLKKYHIKATAYIIPGFIDGSDFLTQEQLQDVIDSGLVDVGAHTVHHVSLSKQSLATDQYEIAESKKMLEDMYHIHVVSFAYPNGAFDLQAANVVKEAGFSTAVSTIPGHIS